VNIFPAPDSPVVFTVSTNISALTIVIPDIFFGNSKKKSQQPKFMKKDLPISLQIK
jgi:hypothetical protein